MSAVSITTVRSADAINPDDWVHLSPPGHPFLNADFLTTLELHEAAGPRCGWHAHHQVAKTAEGALVGIMPSYIKMNSHGDFLRDWSWAAAYEQLGKPYFPKLISGLPHTPASGHRFLVNTEYGVEDIRQQLIARAKELVTEQQLSSWHVALPADEEIDALRANGLLVSHDVQFQWRNRGYGDFDGYLAAFPSEKRRKVRAERRKVAESGISIEVRHGNEIAPHAPIDRPASRTPAAGNCRLCGRSGYPPAIPHSYCGLIEKSRQKSASTATFWLFAAAKP
jgi:predicted N-acyltransferase